MYLPDADVAHGYAPGIEVRPASSLTRKSADRILYLLGNERAHAFMLPLIRNIGGTVYLHDWVLFDLMTAAFPALERGGLAGHLAAWNCGGLRQRSIWAEARSGGSTPTSNRPDHGRLLMGWHEPEADGRWTTRRAGMSAPRGHDRSPEGTRQPDRQHHGRSGRLGPARRRPRVPRRHLGGRPHPPRQRRRARVGRVRAGVDLEHRFRPGSRRSARARGPVSTRRDVVRPTLRPVLPPTRRALR